MEFPQLMIVFVFETLSSEADFINKFQSRKFTLVCIKAPDWMLQAKWLVWTNQSVLFQHSVVTLLWNKFMALVPGLVVKGGDSWSRSREFESISHYFLLLKLLQKRKQNGREKFSRIKNLSQFRIKYFLPFLPNL